MRQTWCSAQCFCDSRSETKPGTTTLFSSDVYVCMLHFLLVVVRSSPLHLLLHCRLLSFCPAGL